MMNRLASFRVIACIATLACALAAASTVAAPTDASCHQDADCKLIYSSCGCEAVLASDLRDALKDERGIDCHHNACRSDHAQAICVDGRCEKTLPNPPAHAATDH